MKHLILAAVGALTVAAGSPLAAQGDATYADWEHLLRNRVNDLLYYPQAANGAAGDVLVGFRIGPDGMPTDIVMRQSSGVQVLDQSAVQLVSRLGRIGPAPTEDGELRQIVFRLSYSDSAPTIASMKLTKPDRIANERREPATAAASQGQPRR